MTHDARIKAIASGQTTAQDVATSLTDGERAGWSSYELRYGSSTAEVKAYWDVLALLPKPAPPPSYRYSADVERMQTGRDPRSMRESREDAMTTTIKRDSHTTPAEPYLYYDDNDNPGWVLRYSLSDEIGQCHLDEPIGVDNEDASDDELQDAAQVALRYVGVQGADREQD